MAYLGALVQVPVGHLVVVGRLRVHLAGGAGIGVGVGGRGWRGQGWRARARSVCWSRSGSRDSVCCTGPLPEGKSRPVSAPVLQQSRFGGIWPAAVSMVNRRGHAAARGLQEGAGRHLCVGEREERLPRRQRIRHPAQDPDRRRSGHGAGPCGHRVEVELTPVEEERRKVADQAQVGRVVRVQDRHQAGVGLAGRAQLIVNAGAGVVQAGGEGLLQQEAVLGRGTRPSTYWVATSSVPPARLAASCATGRRSVGTTTAPRSEK